MIIPSVIDRRRGGERQNDVFSAMLDERAVFLNGEVTDEMAELIVAELLFLEAQDPKRPVAMYINSPGGSVTAGLAIYDTMRHVRPRIHTLCVGQACSMAAVLLAAGDERSILPSARVMIHQPSGGAQGKQTDILITAREITRMRADLVKKLAYHTKRDPKVVEEDLEKDYFMSAEQAVEYGLVDDIIMPEEKDLPEEEN